jgi:hypothetical protein
MAISLVGREYLNFWGNNATIVKNCKGFCDFQPIFLLNHSKSMTEFATKLVESLQPISDQFKSLNIPEPVTHWGHPFFMGIVIVAMGSFVAISGWRSRTTTDPEVATKNKADHRKVAPLMTVFLATGYTGGLLSLVMQGKPLLESPHFITGSVVLTLLAINGAISLTGFGGNQPLLRNAHAYLGSAIVMLLVAHAFLGLKLGLSI